MRGSWTLALSSRALLKNAKDTPLAGSAQQ